MIPKLCFALGTRIRLSRYFMMEEDDSMEFYEAREWRDQEGCVDSCYAAHRDSESGGSPSPSLMC